MSNFESENQSGSSLMKTLLTNFTTKMTKALTKMQTPTLTVEPSTALIGIKLDNTNHALWSQVVEMYISDKDYKLGYINGNIPKPPKLICPFEIGALTMPLSMAGLSIPWILP